MRYCTHGMSRNTCLLCAIAEQTAAVTKTEMRQIGPGRWTFTATLRK